jgi:hypothetical protein
MFFRRGPHPTQTDLSAYIDGELPVTQARYVASHAESCAACQAQLDELSETKNLLSELPRPALPRTFVLSAERAGIQTAMAPARPTAWRFAPAAALSLFVALVLIDVAAPTGSSDETAGTRPQAELASKAADQSDSAAPAQRSLQATPPAVGAIAPSAAPAPPGGAGAAQDAGAAPQPPVFAPPVAAEGAPAPTTPAPENAGRQALIAPTVAAPTPFAGGVIIPPATVEAAALSRSSEDEGSGLSLLNILEIMAAAAFVVSVVVLLWPKLSRKEPQ